MADADEMVIQEAEVISGYIDSLVVLLADIANALAGATAGNEISDTTIDGWKTDVATARTNADAARDAVADAIEALEVCACCSACCGARATSNLC